MALLEPSEPVKSRKLSPVSLFYHWRRRPAPPRCAPAASRATPPKRVVPARLSDRGIAVRVTSSPVAGTKSDYIALAEANPNSIGIML